MAELPRCNELRRSCCSKEWEDMFILYCRRATAAEYLSLAGEINGLCDGLTASNEEREYFIDELDLLVDRFVPEKMAEFLKETQEKDKNRLMRLQILGREFELRAVEKNHFIEKLKGNGLSGCFTMLKLLGVYALAGFRLTGVWCCFGVASGVRVVVLSVSSPNEPKSHVFPPNAIQVVQIVLWYVNSGCSKHMTGNRSQLMNFISKFLGTVRFRKDQISKIMGYDDYQLGNLAKDGLARGIPKLKFKKDHLCSACALGKSKKSSHQPKAKDTNQEKLYLSHMDLCGPMRVESINRKKYILVIVDDYSRFTWVRFLRSKDEAPDAIIKCIKNIQVRLNATVRNV
ncbi:retrovirus-related pol polyprotein from transposon TNT 1-94 [Tanacetum coccineum]